MAEGNVAATTHETEEHILDEAVDLDNDGDFNTPMDDTPDLMKKIFIMQTVLLHPLDKIHLRHQQGGQRKGRQA